MAKATKDKTKTKSKSKEKGRIAGFSGKTGTKEQMDIPASHATQLDPVLRPDALKPDDTELVMDPDSRGWVQFGQVKESREKAAEADKASVESGQKQADKNKADADEHTAASPYGEPVPDEVRAARERGEEVEEIGKVERKEALEEDARIRQARGGRPISPPKEKERSEVK